MITQSIVFTKEEEQFILKLDEEGYKPWDFHPQRSYILDALMSMTGSEFKESSMKAFSTLSCLSTTASNHSHVKTIIERDMKFPSGIEATQKAEWFEKRLKQAIEVFRQEHLVEGIEEEYAGLYALLQLSENPCEEVIGEAAQLMHEFYFPFGHSEEL